MSTARWLYHVKYKDAPWAEPYAPPSLASEGFIHCSFRDRVLESARLYFDASRAVEIVQLDPRALGATITIADTPRGPMPHVHGAIPGAAVVARFAPEAFTHAPDAL